MVEIFKKKRKQEKKTIAQKNILNTAVDLGLIKKENYGYIITSLGYETGCYKTRTGGIGFTGQSILLLVNS